MHPLVLQLLALDPIPDDNDVKAGWVAFGVFALLIVAVVVLMRSFVIQMRKVEAADQAGVYDEKPADGATLPPTHTPSDS